MDQSSWNWLAPRFFVRLASGSTTDTPSARPCMPAVEQLGDRILLSAVPAATDGGQIPPGPCLVATLNGMIGQPGSSDSVLIGELNAMKLAGQISLVSNTKWDGQNLENEFIKLNDLFSKADAALTLGLFTPDVQAKLLTDLNTEFDKLTKEPVLANELQRAKNQFARDYIVSRESNEDKARHLAHSAVIHNDIAAADGEFDIFMNVTQADVLRVAKTYFTPNNRVVLHILPKTGGSR